MREYEDIDMDTFGGRLYYALRSKKMTQREFARRIGVSERTVNYYINNQRIPDTETLIGISQILRTSIDYLLGLYFTVEDPELSHKYVINMVKTHYYGWNNSQRNDLDKVLKEIEEREQNRNW